MLSPDAANDWTLLDRLTWQEGGPSARLLTALGVAHGFTGAGAKPPPDVHHARQVHGTTIVEAPSARTGYGDRQDRQEADGLTTTVLGTAVAAKTADCLPVLLVQPGRVAAAVHAGWRGLTKGILGVAVRAAAAAGAPAADLYAVIGPAIGRERYEVGPEVAAAVAGAALGLAPAQAGLALAKGRTDRWHLDLQVAAAFALLNAGLAPERIAVMRACTYEDHAWNSYRRDGAGFGSNYSWIRL